MKGTEESVRGLVARLTTAYRQHKAKKDLERRRNTWLSSYEGQRFRERREAAKRGWDRRKGLEIPGSLR